MAKPDSPWTLTPATLDWQDGLPRSAGFGDIYFSAADGLAETRHVFLQGNHLPERWQSMPARGQGHFTIAETGFGTGLNFLATWQAWQQYAPAGTWLHYLSVEKHPLRPADLQRALAHWPELAALAEALQQAYPPLVGGHHYRVFPEARISLHLVFSDATEALPEWLDSPQPGLPREWQVDAWFLDGFAPKRNPGLWQPALFRLMRRLSAGDATLATFTAAGEVRRALASAGFRVERSAGFGRKRHMTIATAVPAPDSGDMPVTRYLKQETPWHLPLRTCDTRQRHAVVIGAGLAGLFTAWSLAQRGWQVTVVDAETPAAGASGNRQGILFHRLSAEDSPVARFSQQAFLYSSHWYRQAIRKGSLPADALHAEGMLQLPASPAQAQAFGELAALFQDSPGLAQWLPADEASILAGLPLPGPALYWPGSATVSPHVLCAALATHTGITLACGKRVVQLQQERGQWQALDAAGQVVAGAAVMVIACGTTSMALGQTAWLPFKPLRGQVSHVEATPGSTPLRCAVCHDGYITPARDGLHCIGASFDIGNDNPALTAASHVDNLERLRIHWPHMGARLDAAVPDPALLEGRVGFRCTSPDYLPAIGPVPDAAAFRTRFATLAGNARRRVDATAPMLPGLYVNTGHGSRGLTYAPLAGELLASFIEGTERPVDPGLCRAIAPARFLARALIRREEN